MSDPKNNFIDYVQISVKAGDGGQGCISFMRDRGKPFGGPSGGDGGRGGSIFLEAEEEMVTLLDFKLKPRFMAERGEHGLGKNCSGKSGGDVVLKVPLGTSVIDAKTHDLIGDLTVHGQRLRIAKGGDGGRGNQHFATPMNKAPRKAEAGWPGDEKLLVLELKVIADAGLVGLPNAGKSTLLSKFTSANPKIAPYPFTTISPNLGVFMTEDFQRRITLADIPGLIEGAHRGAGLGDRFLRHIERTKVLVHLVGPNAGMSVEEGQMTIADSTPETLLYSYHLVREELGQYSADLLTKRCIVCLSKIDLMDPEEVEAIVAAFAGEGITIHPLSAETGEGLERLRQLIANEVLAQLDDPLVPETPTKSATDEFFAPTQESPEP